jgi:hypothetical protein
VPSDEPEVTKEMILSAYDKARGNHTKAAKILGIERNRLYRRMRSWRWRPRRSDRKDAARVPPVEWPDHASVEHPIRAMANKGANVGHKALHERPVLLRTVDVMTLMRPALCSGDGRPPTGRS